MIQFFRSALLLALLLVGANAHSQNLNITARGIASYPGQTMANICGYAAGGREYALAGASKGLAIIDVTNPDTLKKIVQLPGPDNLWKEIKTYKNYAYVTSEGGQGLQIVDLTKLPDADLDYRFYTGDGDIADMLETIHALHIDTTKGYAYLYGSNLFSGGAVVLDLNTDPYNPTFAGKYDGLGYIHDGWVDNDTLYGSHIYTGFFSVVNMADKSNPELISTQPTPNVFTHNTWMSRDRKTMFSTDEVNDSYLASYDISDPTDIKFLDKVQSNPGSGSMVHNTHILDDYAITSWYADGVTIVDVTRPDNLVQVGNYDIVPSLSGGGSNGCWGVYPYLPSGNLIATVMASGSVWVLTPTYKRAAYLEGKVTDATTGLPINGVNIEVVGSTPVISELTTPQGAYKIGQPAAGTIQVKATKLGYAQQVLSVSVATGQVSTLDFAMMPVQTVSFGGIVKDAATGLPVPDAQVAVLGLADFKTTADANGVFTFSGVFPGGYEVVAGKWGYKYAVLNNHPVVAGENLIMEVNKGYQDDFVFDYGWSVEGTSTQGIWEIGEPLGINPGILLSPDQDVANDVGKTCYVTGNSTVNVAEDDVESGTMILTSPVMDLSSYNQPTLKASLFFTSVTINQETFDSLKIYVSNGAEEKQIFGFSGLTFSWRTLIKNLKNELPITNTMRIRIECFDDPAFAELDSYEAAFDFFRVDEGAPSSTFEPGLAVTLTASPNPFEGQTTVACQFDGSGEYALEVTDITGRLVERRMVSGTQTRETLGLGWQPGVYVVRAVQSDRVSAPIKIVKMNK